MKKPLFIDFSYKDGIHEHLKKADSRELIYPLYKNYRELEKKVFMRIPLFLQKKLGIWIPMYTRWGDWKKKLHLYDNIIVTANFHTIPLVKYLNKKFPQLIVHVFYFNPISEDVPLKFFKKLNCNIWSFDKKDCKKYSLNYNNQFVVKENYENVKREIINDVVFVGADKGRLKSLLQVEKQLNKKAIKTNFHVVATFGEENINKYKYKKYLSYTEIVNLEAESKVILDYVQDGQIGQTIRPLEAIFLNKKVITNNKSIIEELYYSKDNFFVLGKDNIEDIYKFVNSNSKQIANIDLTYEIDGWLMNFVNSDLSN